MTTINVLSQDVAMTSQQSQTQSQQTQFVSQPSKQQVVQQASTQQQQPQQQQSSFNDFPQVCIVKNINFIEYVFICFIYLYFYIV